MPVTAVSFTGSASFGDGGTFEAHPAVRYDEVDIAYRGFVAGPHQAVFDGAAGDAERFARAYARWGPELARHVDGEFALAIYDRRRRRLTLAHDELGLMPLFYAAGARTVTFGSHLAAVVRATGTGTLDEEYLADYLAQGEHFGERTPFAHVRRLLPGQTLTWENGTMHALDTATLHNVPPLRLPADRDYDDRLRALLIEAVDACTPPSARVWCELSGGLDSSTLLALAHARNPAVEAVSFVFSRSYLSDETEWIRPVLEWYPVPWHPIDNDAVRPFTELPRLPHAEPNEWIARAGLERVYTEMLERHAVDIVLSGEGGDAVLLGDEQFPFYLADDLSRGRLVTLWQDLGEWTRGRRSRTYGFLTNVLRPALRYIASVPLEYRSTAISWAAPAFERRARLIKRGRSSWLPRARTVGAAYSLQRIRLAAHIVAVQHQHRTIRTEFRHPLLYRPLVAFMLATPPRVKFRPNEQRVLQRRALAGILPDQTLYRTTKGGSCQPHIDGLERSTLWFRALTREPQLAAHGFVDADAWRAAVGLARFGRMPSLKAFQASATLEIWLQQMHRLLEPAPHEAGDPPQIAATLETR